jgi:hypothetical protein
LVNRNLRLLCDGVSSEFAMLSVGREAVRGRGQKQHPRRSRRFFFRFDDDEEAPPVLRFSTTSRSLFAFLSATQPKNTPHFFHDPRFTMAEPHVDYEWDFDSPLRWEDELEEDGDGNGGDDDDEEEDEEDTAPREEEEEEDEMVELCPRPYKRVRLVSFAPGPLDTLDG